MHLPRIPSVVIFWTAALAAAAIQRAQAAPPGAGWTETFSDEFNNESGYNTAVWSPLIIWGGHTCGNSEELEYFVNSPQNIDLTSGSTVRLTAIANNPVAGATWSSGMLSSYPGFNQAFGYFEISAKVPSGSGFWPAFWMLEGVTESAPYIWPPEIDIMEYQGNQPYVDFMTNHYSSYYPLDGGTASGLGDIYTASEVLSQAFHTYAVDWEPDQITWYLDGNVRYSTTSNVPYLRAMHVMINLAIGGWNGNAPNADTVFPQSFEVDYVRAYSRALPIPWAAQDIGSPANAGRTNASPSGLFNLCGSGAGVSGTGDQCQFAYLPLNGNGSIIARVKNEVGTNSRVVAAVPAAAAGLMIRASLNANATNAFMALRPVINGTAGGDIFSSRTATGGATSAAVLNNSQGAPSWLMLARSGTTFTGYSSTDGNTWVASGTATINMATTAYVGFAVTCSSTGDRATAQFDNISVTGTAMPVLTSISVSPPSARMEPNSTMQFTGTASDQYGNPLAQQPALTWNVTGGGSINSSGLFTSGTSYGGPVNVMASSAGVTGTTPVYIVDAPNAPSGLTATPTTMLPGEIKLNWTNNSNIESGFNIVLVGTAGSSSIVTGTVGPGVTTWTRTGLSMPSGPYIYEVYATGAAGLNSGFSNAVTVSLPTPPSGPTGLTATPGTNKVTLSWNAVSGASNYNIQRATASGGPFSVIKYNNGSTTYSDTTVTDGATYYYEVNYNTSAGASLYSTPPVSATPNGTFASISVTPASASVQTASSQQFSAVGMDSFGDAVNPQPTFTWAVSGGETINSSGLFTSGAVTGGPYTVTASSGGISGSAAVTVILPPVLTTITVSPATATVESGATQQFNAVALDQYGNNITPQPAFTWNATGGGTINSSGLFSATTIGGLFTISAASGGVTGTAGVTVTAGIPAAPTSLTATYSTMLNGWFTLNWTNNANDQTGFTLESLSGTTWSTYATVSGTLSTYTRTGLAMPSGPYNLRVVATNASGTSAPSNQVIFSLPTPPSGPGGLIATGSSGAVILSWVPVSGASNYNIQRATAAAGPFSVIKYNNGGATYTDTGVTTGTTYYYEVDYNTSAGGSLYSTPPASGTPTGPLASISVAPATATVQSGSSQQFTAVGHDLFGDNVNPQPAFTWTVSGGGTINSSGLFASGSNAGGPYTVTAASGAASGTAGVTVALIGPYQQWEQGYFGTANAGDPNGGDMATPLGDGITNLMKYALGLNPTLPVASGMPQAGYSGGLLSITFARMKSATDITYHVQGSADLNSWTEIWNSGSVAYGGGASPSQQVTVTDTGGPQAGRTFLRLEITDP